MGIHYIWCKMQFPQNLNAPKLKVHTNQFYQRILLILGIDRTRQMGESLLQLTLIIIVITIPISTIV